MQWIKNSIKIHIVKYSRKIESIIPADTSVSAAATSHSLCRGRMQARAAERKILLVFPRWPELIRFVRESGADADVSAVTFR